MKKFIISAVMALLIGGFAFTANAQPGSDAAKQNEKAKFEQANSEKKVKMNSKINEGSSKAVDKQNKAVEQQKAEEQKKAAEQQSYDLLNSQYQDAINKFEADFNKFKEGKDTEKLNLQGDMKKAEDKRKAIEKIENKLTSKQKDTFKELKEKHDRLLSNYEKFFRK